MKKKNYLLAIGLALLCGITALGSVYAGSSASGKGILLYARRGSDDNGHHSRGSHRYYRHYRYFPHDYYYYKKVYHFPFKRYYYYYDVYPEKIYYYESERDIYAANPDYIPVTSIANMASQGVPDAVIISEIERTHSVYRLTSEIITYLKQNGVSDRVIDVMIASAKN